MEETKDLFVVRFSDDGSMGIEFSEEFLSLSLEDQLKAMEAFWGKKNMVAFSSLEVNREMTEHELTLVVLECLLAKLKRGEHIRKDTDIKISMDDLAGSDDSLFG